MRRLPLNIIDAININIAQTIIEIKMFAINNSILNLLICIGEHILRFFKFVSFSFIIVMDTIRIIIAIRG